MVTKLTQKQKRGLRLLQIFEERKMSIVRWDQVDEYELVFVAVALISI
jgi:hypothetical protein